jgi:integrase
MVAWWKEMGRPLAAFFGDKPLRKISPADLAAYQNHRRDLGRAPKTVNSELSVLRQLLKHAKIWYRFLEDYRPLKNTKPPAGQALTDEEQARLFELARSKPAWFFAYVAATLDFFCGLRACEIKALQWKHISLEERRLSVRRSKTPAGWRDPSLNDTCVEALGELHAQASRLGFTDPDHFLFPWHGQHRRLDPSRPMTSWRSAWRSLRRAAGLPRVRFHDGRHTALTRLAEKGVADWVIRAQFGHVSRAMMAVYSHVRRKALDEAASALEPDVTSNATPPTQPPRPKRSRRVMSHVTSQRGSPRQNVINFPKEFGAPSTTRTCDLLVRRLMQVLFLVGFSSVWPLSVPAVIWCSGANCSRIVHSYLFRSGRYGSALAAIDEQSSQGPPRKIVAGVCSALVQIVGSPRGHLRAFRLGQARLRRLREQA